MKLNYIRYYSILKWFIKPDDTYMYMVQSEKCWNILKHRLPLFISVIIYVCERNTLWKKDFGFFLKMNRKIVTVTVKILVQSGTRTYSTHYTYYHSPTLLKLISICNHYIPRYASYPKAVTAVTSLTV